MIRPLKIGVLCPFSTIYPSLSQDFMDGIRCGLPEKLHSYFQFIPEFVRQGEPAALKPALEKFIGFDNVDLITGLVGYRTISEFVPLIERNKKISLFADMGEYIPFPGLTSDYLFFNSFQYWQAEYALGQWTQQEKGGKGSVFMAVYDSGYHMHSTFRMGAGAGGGSEIDYAVIRYSQEVSYTVEDALLEYMEKFKKERPQFIHAVFSGTEAVEFFSLYHREGLHKEIPLIVSPHMASQEILSQIEHLDMTFHTASLWNYNAEDTLSRNFRTKYVNGTGAMPNVFSLLGYEVGQALEMCYPALSARDFDTARKLLKEERIKTPRGERNFYLDSKYATPVIDIEQVTIQNNKARKVVVAQGRSFQYNHFVFEEIHRENKTGWFNPYLCV